MGPPRQIFEQYNQSVGLMPRNLGAAAAQEDGMLKEFVEKIVSLAEPSMRVEEDGRVYSDKQLVEIKTPLITPITVQTLAGLRDLYKLHDRAEQSVIIQIQDHSSVWMMAAEVDEWNRRPALVHAQIPNDAPRFRFGQWMDPDEFVIGLLTLFDDAAFGSVHAKVVKLVSSLAAEAVTISNDDGYSQQVVTKQGMVSKTEEKVSPRVSLAPFRTFHEVAQPSTDFILRLRSRSGQMPSCALFEADGGAWKMEAIKSIKEYFEKELEGADIVA
jgi:hypothetical protein